MKEDAFTQFLKVQKPKRLCSVCNSPHRVLIDEVMSSGRWQGRRATISDVLNWLNTPTPDGPFQPGDRHWTRHMLEGHKNRGHIADPLV